MEGDGMERQLLTVEEFGDVVGCGRSMAYQLVAAKRVRTVRMTPRGALRVPVDAVGEFINSLESAATENAAA
jgi:excisionase family DNA binding protein